MSIANRFHRIRYSGTGADLSIIEVPHDQDGRPTLASAATYAIYDVRYDIDDSNRTIVSAGTAATVDSVSTTISSAAGAGEADRTKLTVASATGITAGHAYLLTDATTGHRELVRVVSVVSSNVYIDAALTRAFASSSTFQGIEVTATFDSTEAADEDRLIDGGGPYVIEWVWTGVTPTKRRSYIWVQRHPELPFSVDLIDCYPVDITLADELANVGGGRASQMCLNQAHEDLRTELDKAAVPPERWHGGRSEVEYVKARWAYHGRKTLGGSEGSHNWVMAGEHRMNAGNIIRTITQHGHNPVGVVRPDLTNDKAESGTSTLTGGLWGKT